MGKPTASTFHVPTREDESGEAVPPQQPGVITVYPGDEGVIVLGRPAPTHQPCVYTVYPRGWRYLRIDPEGLYWPGDSKPEGFGEVGLAPERWYADKRGPIAFDDAVELARHCLYFRPDPERERELHDWLVSSFFTLAFAGDGEDSPCFANGSAYIPVTPEMLPAGLALNEAAVTRCIQKAASSRIHHDALRKAAAILLRARLTGALADWAADVLEPASRAPDGERGRRPWVNTLRNKAIVATIERLEAEGLTATRNEVSAPISACDAVAKAINLSYKGVLDVWKKRPARA